MKLHSVFIGFIAGFVILVCNAHLSNAANIRITSGEHPNFSRIVFNFRNSANWEFGRVEGGFEFISADTEAVYILEAVFEQIPRLRINDIQDLGNGSAFFSVDCDCHGNAFSLERGQVVIDIIDGPSPQISDVFNQLLRPRNGGGHPTVEPDIGSPRGQGLTLTAEILIENPVAGEPPENARESRQGLPLLLSSVEYKSNEVELTVQSSIIAQADDIIEPAIIETPDMSDAILSDALTNNVVISDLDQRVGKAEAHLIEQIGRAATQGLLQPNVTGFPSDLDEESDSLEPSTLDIESPSVMAPAPPDVVSSPETHVTIQTSIDLANQITLPNAQITADGNACLDDQLFNVAEWGGDINNGAYLGEYRSGISGEFDSIKPVAIQGLVKHYLYLTFGAEAVELLKTFEQELGRSDILLILADIVDNLYSDQGGGLIQYLACDGKVALWAALAQKHLGPTQEINGAAITAAFSELPLHLRRYFGPSLATRLIDVGEIETATNLRNAIGRAAGDHGAGVTFLDAKIAIDQHQPETAVDALTSIVAGNADLAPEAIENLIGYKISQGIEITEPEIAIIETLAFELRGTAAGRSLAQAEIVALADVARFSEALAKFNAYKTQGNTGPEAENAILSHILESVVEKGQDAVFLRYAIGFPTDIKLSEEIRYNVALRIHELGLHFDAREFLGRSAQVPSVNERRLFTAIALAEGKFDVALGYLAGLDDEIDLLLAAKAYVGKQNLAEAAVLFKRAGDPKNHLLTAWRAGDWRQVIELDQGALGQASALMLSDLPSMPDLPIQNGALASDAELLTHSQKTRGVISLLLNEVILNSP